MTSLTHQELELRSETRANSSLLERLRVYRDRRQAYTSLVALDDRLLADIGLHRADIKATVFGENKGEKPSLFAKLRLWIISPRPPLSYCSAENGACNRLSR